MPEPVSLSELKAWARVDHEEDDTLIEGLGIAAREYVETATGRTFDQEVPERAKIAIKAVAAHFYEHRGDTDAEPPAHVRRLVGQLRNWSEPEDVGA